MSILYLIATQKCSRGTLREDHWAAFHDEIMLIAVPQVFLEHSYALYMHLHRLIHYVPSLCVPGCEDLQTLSLQGQF